MTVKVYAGITLRRADSIIFGTLVRLERATAGITTDGELRVGDFVEFQLELTGWDQTVMGIAEVRRADIRTGRLNRFMLRILEMRRTDRRNLEAWYQEQQAQARAQADQALVQRALDSQVGSHVPSRVARDLPRAGGGRVPVTAPVSNWSTERALSISQTVEHQGSRRQALRAVLRAAYGEPLPASTTEASSPTFDGPEVRVFPRAEPLRVELSYPDMPTWQADWTAWLYQGLVFVKHTRYSPELEQPAIVRLYFPGFVDLRCPARVVMAHGTGFGLALDLDPHQHESLRSLARQGAIDATPAAFSMSLDTSHEASSPMGRAFWSRLFGVEASADPLEEAIGNLVDPLAPLQMDDPRQRRELGELLARADVDYLVLCDQVSELLADSSWRWPALEDLSRDAADPMSQAAAYIVLAHVTRLEAIEALHKAAAQARSVPSRVEIGPSSGVLPCPECREHQGDPTTPAALARRGLPPFHLGCQCRVVRVLDDHTEA